MVMNNGGLEAFLPTLTEFAREIGGYASLEDDTEKTWGTRHCQLSWTNRSQCLSTLYVNGGPPYHVHVLCWGRHRLLGRKDWSDVDAEDTLEFRRSVLEQAVAWADQLSEPC